MGSLLPTDALAGLLAQTFSADKIKRNDAEKQITELRTHRWYLSSLLQVSTDSNQPTEIKKAAAIQLKNGVKRVWRVPKRQTQNSNRESNLQLEYNLQDDERELLKQHILQALSHVAKEPQLLKLLGEVVLIISREDFPEKWGGLINQLVEFLKTGDLNGSVAALVATEKIVKGAVTKTHKDLIVAIFPLLTELSQKLISSFNDSLEYWTVIGYLAKIYYHCIWYKLPEFLQQPSLAHAWIDLVNRVLRFPTPKNNAYPANVEKRKTAQWVAKKYCSKILFRLFERYGFVQYCEKEDIGFAKLMNTVPQGSNETPAIRGLQTSFQLINTFVSGEYVTPIVLRFSIFYVCKACETSDGFMVVKPVIKQFLENVVFRLLMMQPQDLEAFVTDEAQFIRDKFSVDFLLNIIADPSEAAGSFVEEVTSGRTRYVLQDLINCINLHLSGNSITQELVAHTANQYKDTLETMQAESKLSFSGEEFTLAVRKTAAFGALEQISNLLVKHKVVPEDQTARLLLTEVVPDLKSKFGFLRFYALRCLSKFTRFHWNKHTTSEVIQSLTETILSMLNDPEDPVAAQATVTVANIVKGTNILMLQTVSRHLTAVITKILEVSKRIVLEDIFEALQRIISRFSHQMGPLAPQLLTNLNDSFISLFTTENDDNDDFNETDLAASDCLSSMNELLISVGEQENGEVIIRNCFQAVWPSLCVVFFGLGNSAVILNSGGKVPEDQLMNKIHLQLEGKASDSVDFIQAGLETVRIITFYGKFVPQPLWRIVPYLYIEYTSWADDYSQDIASSLENLIHYDTEGLFSHNFCENKLMGKSNFEVILQVAEYALKSKKEDIQEYDKTYILSMLQILVQCIKLKPNLSQSGSFSGILGSLIDLCLELLPEADTTMFKVNILVLIQSCIFFDAKFSVDKIGIQNFEQILLLWIENLEFHKALAEQLSSYFAFCSLLQLDSLAKYIPEILKHIVKLSVSISELKKANEEMKRKTSEERAKMAAALTCADSNQLGDGLLEEDDDAVDGVWAVKRSKYPMDVPEELNVISPEFANTLPDTMREIESLNRFIPGGVKPAIPQNTEAIQALAQKYGADVDDFGEEEQMDGEEGELLMNAFDDDYSFDEEEEEGEEESPLDSIDEKSFFFNAIDSASTVAQTNFQNGLFGLPTDAQQMLKSMFESGRSR